MPIDWQPRDRGRLHIRRMAMMRIQKPKGKVPAMMNV